MDKKSRFLPFAPLMAVGWIAKIPSFIGSIFGFLIRNWKPVVIIGMLVLILYQNFMKTEWLKWIGIRTIPGLIQQQHDYVEALRLCEDSRTALKMSIERRNEEIDAWARKSEELQNEHNRLSEELLKMKDEADQQIEQILNAPTPNSCKSAMDYLRQSGGAKW